MELQRREFIEMAGGAALAAAVTPAQARQPSAAPEMYGLIVKMIATANQRDALIAILLESVAEMPGCRSYVVARDPADGNAIWITEVWDSKASHDGSLSLPSVQKAIARGKPLIASFGENFETKPVGGFGLSAMKSS